MTLKCCNICKKNKSITAFAKQQNNADNLHYSCKKCVKTRRENNPKHQKSQQKWNLKCKLKLRSNLTKEEYFQLYDKQKGCCAICGRHQNEFLRSLAVDHNHQTGKIRGLLCINCNIGLGNFKDNPINLLKAFQYLRKL